MGVKLSFASDAVAVPIQVRSIAGVANPHRGGACGSSCGAISECTLGRGWFIKQRFRRRARCPVAVIPPVLSVVMAAFRVQTAAVGVGHQRHGGN